jgi:D-xylose reductase
MASISIGSGGKKLPLVGFGLWRIDNDSCGDAVYNAIKAGYRMFDGACGIALHTMMALTHFADR